MSGRGRRSPGESDSDSESRGNDDGIPPPVKHVEIRIPNGIQPSAPPEYDHDDNEAVEEKVQDRISRAKSAIRMARALSQANVVEKSDRPDRRIVRMNTVRDNVHQEVITVYRPWFTFFIIVTNVGVFLYTMWLNGWKFQPMNVNPLLGPSFQTLQDMGAKDTAKIVAGDWWRLFTPIFLHGGVIHLLMNMLMMKRLGQGLEEGFGFFITASIYLISGVSGVICSCVMNKNIIGVGASGALYGLVGALFGDFVQNHKTIVEGKWMYLFSMLISLAIGVVIGMLPVVDNWAHMGGLICGFFLGLILLTNNERDENAKRLVPCYSKLFTFLAALALIIWFLVLLALLYDNKDGNDYCAVCKYVDCVDTPYWTCPKA